MAREKALDYSTKTYANPIRGGGATSRGVKPHQQDYDDEDDE